MPQVDVMPQDLRPFRLSAPFSPAGGQPEAIQMLTQGIRGGVAHQVLLGVTGSGKTYTIANLIEQVQKATLVIAHNKTLAAQLYTEFKTFFPENAVEYFVSYYDYYQPEAYIPHTDTYIAKDSSINDAIDRMRHAATQSLFERNDIIIVASVSCIYGLGSPEAYHDMLVYLEEGREVARDAVLSKLVEIQYTRNDFDFYRGTFRVRGDAVEIFPASSEETCIRLEFFGDRIDAIYQMDALLGTRLRRLPKVAIYPVSHYVIPPARREKALTNIESEMHERIQFFKDRKMFLEAQRIEQRTVFDLEMIREIGYCQGIENYSRHLSGRAPGAPPPTLMDYFPKDYLLVIDESHATIPQIGGMQEGDHARKVNLVEHGFRLPSAFDNRPLTFLEFERFVRQAIYVSATPGPYELGKTENDPIELIIRPTGLLDPMVCVRPATGQIDDLLREIRGRVAKSERTLVTTLTKRMAEDLTEYYQEMGIQVRYLHSDVQTLERMEIIRDLRLGVFDLLIGINLLREGLDLPEVSLVAILDADKEGFLRSYRALIQTAGRAARHISGQVILYANTVTESIRMMMHETDRRRHIQHCHNQERGITPESIRKVITPFQAISEVAQEAPHPSARSRPRGADHKQDMNVLEWSEGNVTTSAAGVDARQIRKLSVEMHKAVKHLEFEQAAQIRDQIKKLQEQALELS